jgi:hypothetical protein
MGGKLAAWVRGHKTASAIGAAGGGLVALLLIKRKSASSSSSSATAPDTSTSSGIPGNPATYAGSNDYTDAYDAAMAGVSDALSQFDFSNSGSTSGGSSGSGVTTSGHGTGDPAKKGKNPNARSWTDTGQSWSAGQLARALGIPVSALRASNAAGSKGLVNPNAPLAKGASYTYLQTPTQAAAGKKPRNPLKRPTPVRKRPGG